MAKDTTKYNFNGKTNLGKNKLAKEIIEKYLSENTNKTYEDLQKIFNRKEFSYKVILNEKDYLNGKKNSKRFFPAIQYGKDNLYITNQWGYWNIEPFIEMAQKEFGYKIEIANNITNTKKNQIKEDEDNKRDNISLGKLDFSHKNLLLKGVPGTGKSRAIENIINKKLELQNHKENILRINIHSASSNADLMQGIGISSKDGKIEYKEKQGLILNLIERATFHPNQSFVLILEEIQENSLNELIGDLIYLIEEDKRAKNIVADDEEYEYQELIEKIIEKNPKTAYVEIPYLVNDSTEYRKMIMPNNLYIFCTSNYRDDKKVIEDNLLRRFEVLEIYPKADVAHEYCRDFFSQLNKKILEVMKDEIHPDRFLIGHSNWLKVDNEEKFYRAFLKVVVEFKDIKEVGFSEFKEIVENLPLVDGLNLSSYKDLIEDLQTKAGYDFLD